MSRFWLIEEQTKQMKTKAAALGAVRCAHHVAQPQRRAAAEGGLRQLGRRSARARVVPRGVVRHRLRSLAAQQPAGGAVELQPPRAARRVAHVHRPEGGDGSGAADEAAHAVQHAANLGEG